MAKFETKKLKKKGFKKGAENPGKWYHHAGSKGRAYNETRTNGKEGYKKKQG